MASDKFVIHLTESCRYSSCDEVLPGLTALIDLIDVWRFRRRRNFPETGPRVDREGGPGWSRAGVVEVTWILCAQWSSREPRSTT